MDVTPVNATKLFGLDVQYKIPLFQRLKCIRLFRPQFHKVKIRFVVEIP